MSYPTPMDVAEAEDRAADALDEALDWPYSREAWDQVDAERLELLAVNDALALEVERMRDLLREVKSVFAGEAAPNWVNDLSVTLFRARWLDRIDAALPQK